MKSDGTTKGLSHFELSGEGFFRKGKPIKAVKDLQRLDRKLGGTHWAFRGHRDALGGLRTKLEEAFDRHGITKKTARSRCEQLVLRDFGRKAYLYLPDGELPAPGDTLEWLSLMRHYNAPTRLLDWTYSIYIATFFALDVSAHGEKCYLWAIDTKWLNNRANRYKGLKKNKDERDKTGNHFRKFFLQNRRPFVSTENPVRLNKRLTMQRGVFLCPGDATKRFVENLNALGHAGTKARYFEIKPSAREGILRLLHRLNIDQEVIFPGIEGLARAMRDRMPRLHAAVTRKSINVAWIGRSAEN